MKFASKSTVHGLPWTFSFPRVSPLPVSFQRKGRGETLGMRVLLGLTQPRSHGLCSTRPPRRETLGPRLGLTKGKTKLFNHPAVRPCFNYAWWTISWMIDHLCIFLSQPSFKRNLKRRREQSGNWRNSFWVCTCTLHSIVRIKKSSLSFHWPSKTNPLAIKLAMKPQKVIRS